MQNIIDSFFRIVVPIAIIIFLIKTYLDVKKENKEKISKWKDFYKLDKISFNKYIEIREKNYVFRVCPPDKNIYVFWINSDKKIVLEGFFNYENEESIKESFKKAAEEIEKIDNAIKICKNISSKNSF